MRKPILTALASVWLAAFSQDHKANLDEATAAIVRELQSGQNQQVMVHTDKPHYKLGNTVYFRVYLFNAITHQPLKSARIHADLFDPSDSLVASLLLNSASFEMVPFRVPEFYEGKTYTVQATDTKGHLTCYLIYDTSIETMDLSGKTVGCRLIGKNRCVQAC